MCRIENGSEGMLSSLFGIEDPHILRIYAFGTAPFRPVEPILSPYGSKTLSSHRRRLWDTWSSVPWSQAVLKSSPDFPPVHTVRDSFPSHGVPSLAVLRHFPKFTLRALRIQIMQWLAIRHIPAVYST